MRAIHEIAADIRDDYRAKGEPVYYAAAPYVNAMFFLDSLEDYYGQDSADGILRYALSNLSSWRGDKAKEIKNEIRRMLGMKETR